MSRYFATIYNTKKDVQHKLESDTEIGLAEQLNNIINEYPAKGIAIEMYQVDDNGNETDRIVWDGKMINLYDYAGVIREAVTKENDADPIWKWSIKSISKDTVKICWGYLKSMNGENDSFILKLKPHFTVDFNEPVSQMLEALHPENIGGRIIYDFVTENPVDENDATCIDTPVVKGIEEMIHRIAVHAHNCY